MTTSEPNYETRWRKIWRQLGVDTPAPDLLDRICLQYDEPHRAYHTLQHIDECLATLDRVSDFAERLAEIEFAIWLHDVVYDPRRTDNEAQSAAQARSMLLQYEVDVDICDRVDDLILATKHDAPVETPDAALLVDIDLAILAAERERFDEYERQVRDEYSFVPLEDFSRGRSRILTAFLDRPAIYSTPQFSELEPLARTNLQRSINHLSGR